MMKRSEKREIIMSALYQISIRTDCKLPYQLTEIINDNNDEFINNIINGVLEHQKELNILADKYLQDWHFKRLDKIAGVILVMAFYELIYTDTPAKVVINEAINLTKKYCDEDIAKMVNAVLDKYLKEKKE